LPDVASKQETSRNDIELLSNLIGSVESPEDDLLTVEEDKLPGSCEWLTSKPEFENWRENLSHNPAIFWLSGMPASGKSVLSSHVIDSLEGHNLDCSFFFFRHGVTKKSTLSDLLRSLAYQMARKNVAIRHRLLQIEADGVTFDKSDERAIWRKLFVNGIFLVKTAAPHYWVIDALDECNKSQALFLMLSKIEVDFPLKIFATSRKISGIQIGMSEMGMNVFHQDIKLTDTVGDIRAFINSKMDRLPVEDEEGRLALSQRILEKADGSFLWVRLVVQELEKTFSEEAVTEVLNDIPAGMNELYARTLDSISNSRKGTSELARVILTWTVCAARPLTLDEMQSVIKLDANQTVPKLGNSVSSICGQLVILDQQSRIQTIHQTAKDYLLRGDPSSEFAINKHAANTRLAINCLQVLSGDALRTAKPHVKKFASKAISGTRDTALLDYACLHFSDHIYESSSAVPEPMNALYYFLKINVLNWIEYLAKVGKTYYIPRAAANIKAYLERRAMFVPPIGIQVHTVEAWVTDLIRVNAKFQANLQACPSSIHNLIPPMCPTETMIHRTHTSPHRGLTVKGLTSTAWDDCLFQTEYRGAQPTAISYGEQFFTVGLSSGEIIMYYADSARIYSTLHHGESINHIEFGSGDKLIASAGRKEIRVWDVAKRQQLHLFKTSRQTLALAFDNENERLMAATQANQVSCWDLKNESQEMGQISWEGLSEVEISQFTTQQSPTQATFSPECDLVAITYRGSPIFLFDLEEEQFFGNLARSKGDNHQPSRDMIFNPNPDLSLFVASYYDGELVLYDCDTLSPITTVPAVNVHRLACSPDGRTLVAGTSFGTIQIFDSYLTLFYEIYAYDEGIREIAFSVDSLRFLDIRGFKCRVWEPAALVRKRVQDERDTSDSSVAKSVSVTAEIHQEPDISALICHPSGDFVFCGKQDGTVAVYSATDGLQVCVLYRHTTETAVTSITFGSTSCIIVSADESGRVMICQLVFSSNQWSKTSLLADVQSGHPVQGLVLSPENRHVIICSGKTIELRAVTGEQIVTVTTASQKPQQAIQHPNFESALIVSDHSAAHIYSWTGLTQLSIEQGIALNSDQATDTFPYSRILCSKELVVQLSKASHTSKDSNFSCWHSSDFKLDPVLTAIVQQGGLANLGSKIEHIIAITGTLLLFLDTDLWVCSLDLKTFCNTLQFKRHFFIPLDWQVASGEMLFQFTSKNDFVFAKRHELIVISRGLNFSEPVTMSQLPKLNIDLPRHGATPCDV